VQLYYFNKGKKLRLDVGIKTKAVYWSDKTQKIGSRCAEIDQDAEQLNTILREKKQKFERIILDYKRKYNINPDCNYVEQQFNLEGSKILNSKEVKQEFAEWIDIKKGKVINSKIFTTISNDLKDYHPKPINYMDLDFIFFEGLKQFYLAKENPIQVSTIIKRFKNFKMFLQDKLIQGVNENDYFSKYKLDFTTKYRQEIIIPTEKEIEILIDYKCPEEFDDARDLYLIGCSTGLRYSDVIRLNKSKIINGFIVTDIKKTKQTINLPLNYLSEKFLNKQFSKYGGSVRQITNQKLNKKLTDLFLLISITKPKEKPFSAQEIVYVQYGPEAKPTYLPKYKVLTFHSARRYFISYCINSGLIALGNVMEWSGHTEIETINRYIKKGYKQQEQMKNIFSLK